MRRPISGLIVGGTLVVIGTAIMVAPAVLVATPGSRPSHLEIQYGKLIEPPRSKRVNRSKITVVVSANGCDAAPTATIYVVPRPTHIALDTHRIPIGEEFAEPNLSSSRRLGECYVTVPSVLVRGVNRWVVRSIIDGVGEPKDPEPPNARVGLDSIEWRCLRAEPRSISEPMPGFFAQCNQAAVADDADGNRREATVLIASTVGFAVGIGLLVAGFGAYAMKPGL